jgi:hypothetical protein
MADQHGKLQIPNSNQPPSAALRSPHTAFRSPHLRLAVSGWRFASLWDLKFGHWSLLTVTRPQICLTGLHLRK